MAGGGATRTFAGRPGLSPQASQPTLPAVTRGRPGPPSYVLAATAAMCPAGTQRGRPGPRRRVAILPEAKGLASHTAWRVRGRPGPAPPTLGASQSDPPTALPAYLVTTTLPTPLLRLPSNLGRWARDIDGGC